MSVLPSSKNISTVRIHDVCPKNIFSPKFGGQLPLPCAPVSYAYDPFHRLSPPVANKNLCDNWSRSYAGQIVLAGTQSTVSKSTDSATLLNDPAAAKNDTDEQCHVKARHRRKLG